MTTLPKKTLTKDWHMKKPIYIGPKYPTWVEILLFVISVTLGLAFVAILFING